MRLEINAGGLDSFFNGISSFINIGINTINSNNLINSYQTVIDKTNNIIGGVRTLDIALQYMQINKEAEERRKIAVQNVKIKTDDFIQTAVQVDIAVARIINSSEEIFYQINPWLRPPVPPSNWEKFWGNVEDTAKKCWDGIVEFLEKPGVFQIITNGFETILGTVAIAVGVFSLITTLGLSTPASIAAITGGAAMLAHGSGGIQEAIDIYKGKDNPQNWLKDLVGEEIYNVIGISGIIVTSVATGGIAGLTSLAVGMGVGEGAGYIAREWFGVSNIASQYIGLIAGTISSGLTMKGLKSKQYKVNTKTATVNNKSGSKTIADGLGDLDWTNTNRKGQTVFDHVQKHAKPNYQREMHGVFKGDVQTIIEEAWANRANAKVVSDGMGGTIYNIPYQNVGYNTGYINFGQQMNYVTIVVQEGTSKIWTAFPSFGDYGMKMSY